MWRNVFRGGRTCKNPCDSLCMINVYDGPMENSINQSNQMYLSDCNWTGTQNHLVRKRTLRPIWPNGWVFIYELNGFGFESSCSHLNFRFHACFEQGIPWHSGNYRVWIHSETRTWHDKNIQSNVFPTIIIQATWVYLHNILLIVYKVKTSVKL